MEHMLKSKVLSYPSHIQAVYVQNIGKLYCKIVSIAERDDDGEVINSVSQLLIDRLPMFVGSSELEVQERVSLLHAARDLCIQFFECVTGLCVAASCQNCAGTAGE